MKKAESQPRLLVLVILFTALSLLHLFLVVCYEKYKAENQKAVNNQILSKQITEDEAFRLVWDLPEVHEWSIYFEDNEPPMPVPVIKIDRTESNKYIIHVYEEHPDRIVTFGWYEVDKRTGKITPWLRIEFAGERLEKLGIRMGEEYSISRKKILEAGWRAVESDIPVDKNFPEISCEESVSVDAVCSVEFVKGDDQLIFYISRGGGRASTNPDPNVWEVGGEL